MDVEDEGVLCEYWINPKFQTCLHLHSEKHRTNVFLLEGKYYARGARRGVPLASCLQTLALSPLRPVFVFRLFLVVVLNRSEWYVLVANFDGAKRKGTGPLSTPFELPQTSDRRRPLAHTS